jgi:hypothetical protein
VTPSPKPSQLGLFAGTVASPWCPYEAPCARQGRAEVGDWRPMGPDARNRTVTCLTCGKSGEQSQNLKLGKGEPGLR